MKPLLSICMAGRNDDYMLDFAYRLSTTLNFYGRSLKTLGRTSQVELLITDWGSDVPLCESVSLTEEACRVSSFLYVRKETISETQDGEGYYHVARACNAGLRRSQGDFIFITSTDQLMPTTSLESLLRLLNGELSVPIETADSFLIVPRIQVPWQFVARKPTLEEWDKFMFLSEYALIHQPALPESNWYGSTSGFVLSREMNLALRGLDEKQPGWGWGDIEYAFRGAREGPPIYLSNLGISSFHMGHPPSGTRHAMKRMNNLGWQAAKERNSENWGLGSFTLNLMHARPKKNNLEDQQLGGKRVRSPRGSDQIASAIAGRSATEHVVKTLEALQSRGISTELSEHGALRFLAWYGLERYPKRYLEIESRDISRSAVVVSACPSVHICAIADIQGDIPGTFLVSKLRTLAELGQRGYYQLINEDNEKALVRPSTSTNIFPDFDLISFRADKTTAVLDEHIGQLIALLAPGGALVVNSDTSVDFEEIWSRVLRVALTLKVAFFRAQGASAGMMLKQLSGSHPSMETAQVQIVELKPIELALRPAEPAHHESVKIRLLRSAWREIKRIKDRLKRLLG